MTKIALEDMEVGGTVFVVSRTGNASHKRRARVLSFTNKAAEVKYLDLPKSRPMMKPLGDIEADPEWLWLRDQRALERERKLDEARASEPLRASLSEREGALQAIAELKERESAPPPPPADEQREREQGRDEGGEQIVREAHIEQPTPAPSPARPNARGPVPKLERGPVAEMQLAEVQSEIDTLEEEQTALLEMLVPLETRLSQLKKRRAALRAYGQPAPLSQIKTPDWRVGQRSYTRRAGGT